MSCHKAADDLKVTYLDRTGGNVSIVREPCGKGWSIVEREGRFVLGQFKLLVERINGVPEFEDFFFFLREIGSVGDYECQGLRETYQWQTLSSCSIL